MKTFLFHNDKATTKDEIKLLLFIVSCLLFGILVYVLAPKDWFVSEIIIKIFGLMFILLGFMFVPALVYRFITNKTSKK